MALEVQERRNGARETSKTQTALNARQAQGRRWMDRSSSMCQNHVFPELRRPCCSHLRPILDHLLSTTRISNSFATAVLLWSPRSTRVWGTLHGTTSFKLCRFGGFLSLTLARPQPRIVRSLHDSWGLGHGQAMKMTHQRCRWHSHARFRDQRASPGKEKSL